MIRRTGFAIIGSMVYGLIESVILGFSTAIIFFLLMITIISSDILIFNLGHASAMKLVSVSRDMKKPYSRKGEFVETVISFTNNSKLTLHFNYFDSLSSVFQTRGDVEGEIRLAPSETVVRKYSISATAIGRYEIGPLLMSADDPLHLALATYSLTANMEVKVAPSTSDTFNRRSERYSNLIYTRGLHISRKVGQGYNFYGIREYDTSDDFRYVAWSRYGIQNGEDLYIKQMEEERQVDVVFVMDYSNSVNQGPPNHLLFDVMISQVIAMSYGIVKNHDGVGFLLTSSTQTVYFKPEKNSRNIDRLEKAVSEMKPSGTFDIADCLGKIKDNVRKEAIIFILTPFGFPEKFNMEKSTVKHLGKKIILVLINRSQFVPELSGPVDQKLFMAAVTKEAAYTKAIAHFFNSIGIRSRQVNENNIVPFIMGEYTYGKVTQ